MKKIDRPAETATPITVTSTDVPNAEVSLLGMINTGLLLVSTAASEDPTVSHRRAVNVRAAWLTTYDRCWRTSAAPLFCHHVWPDK